MRKFLCGLRPNKSDSLGGSEVCFLLRSALASSTIFLGRAFANACALSDPRAAGTPWTFTLSRLGPGLCRFASVLLPFCSGRRPWWWSLQSDPLRTERERERERERETGNTGSVCVGTTNTRLCHSIVGANPHKNSEIKIDVSHSRQPLVKGERLVRYEVNAVMLHLQNSGTNRQMG